MNLVSLLHQSMQHLWGIVAPYLPFIALIFVVRWILKSRWLKGKFGESKVNRILRKRMGGEQYRLIPDVTLPMEDGTTQVDHILVSVFGVFVIETKNMGGWIFGKPEEEKWTQKFRWRKKGYQFQNPRRQNYKHVQAVRALCNLEENQVHSVVVFVGSGRFKSGMPDDVVEGGGNLIRRIKSYTEEVLSLSEVGGVIDKINEVRQSRSMKTDRRHRRHVKGKKQAKAGNVGGKSGADSIPSCPKCGSAMVKRQGKQGAYKGKYFWGCPKFRSAGCRGMRPMDSHD